jgi:hypothetical protein
MLTKECTVPHKRVHECARTSALDQACRRMLMIDALGGPAAEDDGCGHPDRGATAVRAKRSLSTKH